MSPERSSKEHVGVKLDPRLLDRLDDVVDAAEYRNRSAAIREGIRRVVTEIETEQRLAEDPEISEEMIETLREGSR